MTSSDQYRVNIVSSADSFDQHQVKFWWRIHRVYFVVVERSVLASEVNMDLGMNQSLHYRISSVRFKLKLCTGRACMCVNFTVGFHSWPSWFSSMTQVNAMSKHRTGKVICSVTNIMTRMISNRFMLPGSMCKPRDPGLIGPCHRRTSDYMLTSTAMDTFNRSHIMTMTLPTPCRL